MADDTIKIAIEAIDNASATFEKVGDEVEKLGQRGAEAGEGAAKGAQGFESFAGKLVAIQSGIGVAQEALGTLKKVWDFAKEGAENQRIAESFNRTAKSIGADADTIIKKLDEAAHGTVDDEELMQASTRALTLGVAKNGDDLVRVMKLARAAALQFGGDAGQAFETINQAIGNLAPRALKQFGIIVSLKDANEAYAKSINVSADALTEEQQRQALLNAVLVQGDKVFKDIGNSATTAGEKFKRFEAQVANLWDTVKEGAVGAVLPYLDSLRVLEVANDKNATQLDKLNAAYDQAVSMYGENSAQAKAYAEVIEKLTALQERLGTTTEEKAVRAGIAQIRTFEQQSKASGDLEQGIRNQADTYAVLDAAMDRTAAKAALVASSQKMIASDMADLKTVMAGALEKEFINFNAKQDDLSAKAAKVRDELTKLESSQGRAVTSTRKQTLSTAELNLAQLKLKDTQSQLTKETDPLKQAELAVKVEDLTGKINGATSAVTSYIDNSKKISELKGQYDDINKEISANAAAHEDATRRILFGYAEQQLAVGGLTETEAKALDALAVQWGLKSQEDIDAMQRIRDAAAGLAKDGSINEFVDNVTGALVKAEAPLEATNQTLQDVAKSHGALGNLAPVEIKVTADTAPAQKASEDFQAKLRAAPPVEIKATIKVPVLDEIKAQGGDSLAERRAQLERTSGAATDTSKAIGDATSKTINAVGDVASRTTDKVKSVADTTETRLNALASSIATKMNSVTTGIISAFATTNERATGDLLDIITVVDKLPTFKEFVYKITVKGEIPGNIPGAQYGADYIVPPNPRGGTADYFPIAAAPGERVTVQTAAQQNQAKPQGDTYNYTTNVYNPLAAAMLADKQRRDRLARSNSRMGVTQ